MPSMHFYKNIVALFIVSLPLAPAQQSCYWPNGSGIKPDQGVWVNCYSSQDSTCCLNGDVCLSNGLCYGSPIAVTYRGACTVKDWSNTTACPTQWCNDVETNSWSNLWKCPPVNNGPSQWWCGNSSETTPCQAGINAYFPNYSSGSILGFAPVTPSSSALMTTFGSTVTTTFSAGPSPKAATVTASSATTVTAASLAKTSTDPSVPVQTQKHSASLPTALGVGIGVPLGTLTIGVLGFLSWREAVRRRRSKPRILSQEAVLNQTDKSALAAVNGSWTVGHELPDAQRPRELGGNARMELPSI